MSTVRRVGAAFACAALVLLLPLAPPARAAEFANLARSSDPIAADGTLGPGDTVTFSVMTIDRDGNPMSGFHVELVEHENIGHFDLGSGNADAQGKAWVTYHAGSSVPIVHVTDQVQAKVGDYWTSTYYAYLGVGSIVWSTVPIAPNGTLAAGADTTAAATVYDTAGHAMEGVSVDLAWSSDPIAPDGSLAPGATVSFYVTPTDQYGNAMRGLDMELISHENIGRFDLRSGRPDAEGREWAT